MNTLRIATYNIHKGVQGLGPMGRLEIHNLAQAVALMDADIICLQEVHKFHHRHAERFVHWPQAPQAEVLAPPGYHAIYHTNAVTDHGEHGNALLSRWPVAAQRHEDMSDHRLEQRGLLHCELQIQDHLVHTIVVHLGLFRASRVRQLRQLCDFIGRNVPADHPLVVAGDFNDGVALVRGMLQDCGLAPATAEAGPTFPALLPLVQLDHVFTRGLTPSSVHVPRGRKWWRMSDHLPLIAEFEWGSAAP